jgi:hypothetical protein
MEREMLNEIDTDGTGYLLTEDVSAIPSISILGKG